MGTVAFMELRRKSCNDPVNSCSIDHARAITPMPLGQCHDLLSQHDISVRCRLVAISAGAHADYPQGSAFA